MLPHELFSSLDRFLAIFSPKPWYLNPSILPFRPASTLPPLVLGWALRAGAWEFRCMHPVPGAGVHGRATPSQASGAMGSLTRMSLSLIPPRYQA